MSPVVVDSFGPPPAYRKNKKQKQKQKKRQSTVRRNPPAFGALNRLSPDGKLYALAAYNPFASRLDGVRIPDDFTYPTATGVTRTMNVRTTDANGNYAVSMQPFVQDFLYEPASITAPGVITWAGGTGYNWSNVTPFQAQFSMFRLAAWGMKISCDSSITNAVGHISICHLPQDLDTDVIGYTYFPTSEGSALDLPLVETYSMAEICQQPLIIPAKRIDNSSFRFHETIVVSVSPYAEVSQGWCSIVVIANGVTSLKLKIEGIYHYEALPRGTATSSLGADCLPCPFDSAAIELNNKINIGVGVAHRGTDNDEDDESIVDKIERTVMKVAAFAGKAMSTYNAASSAYNQLSGKFRQPQNSYLRLGY